MYFFVLKSGMEGKKWTKTWFLEKNITRIWCMFIFETFIYCWDVCLLLRHLFLCDNCLLFWSLCFVEISAFCCYICSSFRQPLTPALTLTPGQELLETFGAIILSVFLVTMVIECYSFNPDPCPISYSNPYPNLTPALTPTLTLTPVQKKLET